ncbi:hypothetical protein LINPERHAP2_LOCUS21961 [Linum perenne]
MKDTNYNHLHSKHKSFVSKTLNQSGSQNVH